MTIRFCVQVLAASAAAAGVIPSAYAAWSDDPAVNMVVADRSGEQVQPKVVATTDGGCYISWFDNNAGGYDVYLQRLDAAGDEQWTHNGVLVADRGYSSTQDYGLSIDTAGYALLTFRDDRPTDEEITVARVSPEGGLVWGMGGVQVTAAAGAFVAAPKVAGTSDGNAVVAWSHDGGIKAQKLDSDGLPLWGAGITFMPASGFYFFADVQAADAGAAIVSWVPQVGGVSHLWAQKLAAADGASLWDEGHVKVFDDPTGGLGYGYFPSFVSDGAGGAVFAWHGSFGASTIFARVQRVLTGGGEAFAHNGVEASTNTTQHRMGPSAAINPANGDIFVFWTDANSNQSQFGVSGQRIAADGSRQWTDSGTVYVPLSGSQTDGLSTLVLGGEGLAAWVDGIAFGNEPIRATRVDVDGDTVWSPGIADLSTAVSDSFRIGAALSSNGFAIYAWQDGATGASDIKVQNLNPDGTLGDTGSIFSDGFETGEMSAWSVTFP